MDAPQKIFSPVNWPPISSTMAPAERVLVRVMSPRIPYNVPVRTPISCTSLVELISYRWLNKGERLCEDGLSHHHAPDLCHQRGRERNYSAREHSVEHSKCDGTCIAVMKRDPEGPNRDCREEAEDDSGVKSTKVISPPRG